MVSASDMLLPTVLVVGGKKNVNNTWNNLGFDYLYPKMDMGTSAMAVA